MISFSVHVHVYKMHISFVIFDIWHIDEKSLFLIINQYYDTIFQCIYESAKNYVKWCILFFQTCHRVSRKHSWIVVKVELERGRER